jgi:NAD(P) transhydrogenase subunit alpha
VLVACGAVRVGILREHGRGERRVAAVPDAVTTYVRWGWQVAVETDAGSAAGHSDADYEAAGATIVDDAGDADLVLAVRPDAGRLRTVAAGSAVAGFLDPYLDADVMRQCVEGKLTALAVEAIPRTTLAQAMDALSSQANIAGYAAVMLGATATPKLLPMMVTAAGTIPPSRTLILGVGVAGLQAIATAKRLGAVVHAYDIRTATREQVESLGASFVDAVTADADDAGYATEVREDDQARQHAALAPHVAASDLVVTTAQIPGRPAPRLVTGEMIDAMRAGAVIVDTATATGGNVAGSRPDEVVNVGGVQIHGPTNLASMYPADASRMYSRNLLALVERLRGDDGIAFDLDDEIIGGAVVAHGGEARNERTRALLGVGEPA